MTSIQEQEESKKKEKIVRNIKYNGKHVQEEKTNICWNCNGSGVEGNTICFVCHGDGIYDTF